MKTERAGETEGGRLCDEPGHLIDIMATCVDLAGARYPTQFKGQPITPMEGRSLKPFLSSLRLSAPPRPLFWEHEGNAAVRRGDWKLVRFEYRGPWELYNLKADRTEQHDLAPKNPALVTELAGLWESWARRAQVLPVQAFTLAPHGAPTRVDAPASAGQGKAGKKKKRAAR
jgi:arylsulfatase